MIGTSELDTGIEEISWATDRIPHTFGPNLLSGVEHLIGKLEFGKGIEEIIWAIAYPTHPD